MYPGIPQQGRERREERKGERKREKEKKKRKKRAGKTGAVCTMLKSSFYDGSN